MKKFTLTLLISLLGLATIFAQAPQAFQYQTVVRDNAGNILSNQNVNFRMGILQGSVSGTIVYSEMHILATNELGLANLIIGNGIPLGAYDFNDINWGGDLFFLQVELDETGLTNYQLMGTTQLLSVPYALYAEKAGSVEEELVEEIDDLSDGKTGGNSVFLGEGAGMNEDGLMRENTGLGWDALFNTTTGYSNVAIGSYALKSNVANYRSTAIGFNAMYNADNRITGRETYNTAIGYEALKGGIIPSDNTGRYNTAIGDGVLYATTSGETNTGIGDVALYYNTTGNFNTACGGVTLFRNTTGDYNSAMGYASLYKNTTGSYNAVSGSMALFYNTTGSMNTALGYWTGSSCDTGSGNVFIGYQAGYNETGSNKLYIANSSTNPPLIYGDFSTGKVGIGTNQPNTILDIASPADGFISLGRNTNYHGGINFKENDTTKWIFPYFRGWQSDNLIVRDEKHYLDVMTFEYGTGRIGIGTSTPESSALLEVKSTNKGFLPPRMSETQRDAITSPATGLIIYQIDGTVGLCQYNGSAWEAVGGSSPTTYSVGDFAQGGIIFWLDTTGQHGLIAATADQSTGIQWYNGTYSVTNAVRGGISAGKFNTERIIANQGAGAYAAQICANYQGGNYGDWYLPSIQELTLLKSQKTVVGGFTSAFYWSSSEVSSSDVSVCYFQSSALNGIIDKAVPIRVRAVRAF